MSSGIFFRVNREGYESVEIEEMTEDELNEMLYPLNTHSLVNIIKRLLECEK